MSTESLDLAETIAAHKGHRPGCTTAGDQGSPRCLPYLLAELAQEQVAAVARLSAQLGRTENLLGEYMDALGAAQRHARDLAEDYQTAMTDLAEVQS